MQEAEIGMTEMAMNPNTGARGLRPVFQLLPCKNEEKSKEAGRDIFEDREYVTIYIPGQRNNAVERVDQTHIDAFPEEYSRFKRSIDTGDVTEGTPLESWPGLSRSQVAELAYFNIRTVEQLASVSDGASISMIGLNGLKQKAQEYLSASDSQAAANEISELRKRVAELESNNPPKKRGRPPKEKVDQEAD